MLIHILSVSSWIAFTLAFYFAVALACRRMRPSPFMVTTYAAVRSFVSGHSWWRWYAFLFVGTLVAVSICLGCAIFLSAMEDFWHAWTVVVTCLAIGYSALILWPKPVDAPTGRAMLIDAARIILAVTLATAYLFALLRWPNWLTMGIGTYALSVPPLAWLRALRIRTATCLLAAAGVYDAFHVFVSGWMQIFMRNIAGTPFVLQIPSELSLSAAPLCTIGHGDILGSGIMLVVAARAPDRRHASWLVFGTLVGTGAGLALSTWITFNVHSVPALIVLGPCSLLGYVAAYGARKFSPPIP